MGNKHFEKGGEPEELKTLKDIDWENYTLESGERLDGKFLEIIKVEAIKWWRKVNCGDDICCTCEEMWREFFNITSEDLK